MVCPGIHYAVTGGDAWTGKMPCVSLSWDKQEVGAVSLLPVVQKLQFCLLIK